MPGNELSRLEHELAEQVGRSHGIVTGSGTMALTMALEVLGLPQGSEVIVPSVCCPSVPFAVAYAGLVPVFCDISSADYVLDAATVDAALSERDPRGRRGPFVRQSCARRRAGGVRPLSLARPCRGRCAGVRRPVSRRNARPVRGDVDHQFRTRRRSSPPEEAELFSPTTPRPPVGCGTGNACPPARVPTLTSLSRRLYEHVDPTQTGATFPSKAARIRLASRLFKSMSFHRLQPHQATRVSELLPQLDENVDIRNHHASLYRELLTGPGIVHPSAREGGACFRYTVRLEDDSRSRIRRELNRRGIWVSALYPALHDWYGSSRPLQVAESVAPRLLNLPVAPPCGVEDVKRISTMLSELVRAAE